MEINLSGDDALQAVFQHYAWAAHAETALAVGSVVLNLGVVLVGISRPGWFNRSRLGPPPWSFGRGVELAARYGFAFFGVMILTLMLNQEFGAALRRAGVGDLEMTALATALILALSLGLLALFARRNSASIRRYWNGPSSRKAAIGIPVFVLLLLPVSLVTLLAQQVYFRLGLPFDPQPIVSELQNTNATWFVVVLSIFAVVVAPLVEELIFRGVLYPTLKQKWGILPAVIVSSAIFALMHFHMPTLLPLFVLAVILCLAFEYTGCLPVCMVAHALFNSMSIIAVWLLRSLR